MRRCYLTVVMACWALLWMGGMPPAVQPLSARLDSTNPARRHSPSAGGQGTLPEEALADPDEVQVPSAFLSTPPSHSGDVSLIVEKSSQTLILYQMSPHPRELFRVRCSTGKNFGPKTLSGDAKTPEGVYFFTREYEEKYLSPVYGARAFTTDYPNLLDRLARRTGSAIWLHGVDKPLAPFDSNGCVAVGNADLLAISPFITLNRTPIIIVETMGHHAIGTGMAAAEATKALVKAWHLALQEADRQAVAACYAGSPPAAPSWWAPWSRQQEAIQAQGAPLTLSAEDIAVYRHRNTLVAVCDQYLAAGDTAVRVGRKKFFLEYQEGRLVILGDTYQRAPAIYTGDSAANPLLAACRRIGESLSPPVEESTLAAADADAVPIDAWLDDWMLAWSSRDLDAYADFYADKFRSQGMDKNAWLQYKQRVNRRYRFIRLSWENVVLTPRNDRLVVSFTQEYESNLFRSVGIKELVLIRENDGWKIYRERWKRL